jgi:hypothetical protein
VRDAVDAEGAFDERHMMRTAKPCGPDASTPASSLWKATSAGDGGNKADLRGERGISRKPLRGDAGLLRRPRCEYSCAYLLPHAHTRLRVRLAPGIPPALFFERAERCWQHSRDMRGEIADACEDP